MWNNRGSPHRTTFNSTTLATLDDDVHITAQLQGGVRGGRKKVHIYLEGLQDGAAAYDNVSVKGESVMRGSTRDMSLSNGNLPALWDSTASYSERETVAESSGGLKVASEADPLEAPAADYDENFCEHLPKK